MPKLQVHSEKEHNEQNKPEFAPWTYPHIYHMCGSNQYGLWVEVPISIEFASRSDIIIGSGLVCSNCKEFVNKKVNDNIPKEFRRANIIKMLKDFPYRKNFLWYEILSCKEDKRLNPLENENLKSYNIRIKQLYRDLKKEEAENEIIWQLVT